MLSQAHPLVVSYIIQHNITDDGSSTLEELTEWTNITIHGALPGHVYYIQVTPVNVLGPGAARTTRELTHHEPLQSLLYGCSHISCVQHCYYKAHMSLPLIYICIMIAWNVAMFRISLLHVCSLYTM